MDDVAGLVVARLVDGGAVAEDHIAPGVEVVKVTGTGSTFVAVLSAQGGWALPGVHSRRFPRAVVNIYADCSRDEWGAPTAQDAVESAFDVWHKVDRLLHMANASTWPGVVSSRRHTDPDVIPVPDGDGAVLLSTFYEMSL